MSVYSHFMTINSGKIHKVRKDKAKAKRGLQIENPMSIFKARTL